MHNTCHTDLILLTYTVNSDNPHTYPPGYPPIDPQCLQHIENLFQSYVATIEETFKIQFDTKRLGWSKQQQQSTSQEAVLQKQVEDLRLRPEQAELGYNDISHSGY